MCGPVADRWPNVQSACSGAVHGWAGHVRVAASALSYPYKSLAWRAASLVRASGRVVFRRQPLVDPAGQHRLGLHVAPRASGGGCFTASSARRIAAVLRSARQATGSPAAPVADQDPALPFEVAEVVGDRRGAFHADGVGDLPPRRALAVLGDPLSYDREDLFLPLGEVLRAPVQNDEDPARSSDRTGSPQLPLS